MDVFDDIRPFHDREVMPALEKLIGDEAFLKNASQLLFADMNLAGSELVRIMTEKIKSVDSVAKVQEHIEVYFANLIRKTTDGFTFSGEENIDLSKPHVFISNHRDISLDSALVNYSLHSLGYKTARIAAGDNLKTIDGLTDVMRLNKTFFVRRSISGAKALVSALNQLSAYIKHSIEQDNESVWIAQREGRAKDGNDVTAPAVLKMLAMSRDKSKSLKDHFDTLQIVPVCLSYEYDPCDQDKATEILGQQQGGYAKQEHEDIFSIGKGLTGYKGRVHLSYGRPIDQPFDNAVQLAELIDRQIMQNYRFFPSNICAYEQLFGNDNLDLSRQEFDAVSSKQREQFQARIAAAPEAIRELMLKMYSKPLKNYIELNRAVANG